MRKIEQMRFPIMVVIGLLLLFSACSNKSPYADAVELIKQKKYAEAREVLNTIPMGDSTAEKARLAMVVCSVGQHYMAGDYSSALRAIDSAVVEGDKRYYVLNYSPDDPLYSHVATLSVLTYGNIAHEYIDEYLDSEINERNLRWYHGTKRDPEIIIDKVMTTHGDPEYREVDWDNYYGGTLTDPPYIRSVKLDKLAPPPEWETEVFETKQQIEGLLPKIADKKREYEEFEAKHSGFADTYDALNWLLGSNGEENTVWQATEWSEAPRYGKMARMSFFFQRRGGLVFQWDTFLTDREDNVLNNGGTDIVEIESVDGSTINLKWASGTRVSWEKVDENKFKFGSGTLVRTR